MAFFGSAAAAVFCHGPLLLAVQRARIFDDCKTFVDLPMLRDPADILRAFEALPRKVRDASDAPALRVFLLEHFAPEPGADLVPWTPSDATDAPPVLDRIVSGEARAWAVALNSLWPALGRMPSEAARAHPARTSLLPRAHPMLVPGGRFRESYYWDSYWIVLGLLASGMRATAGYVVANLLDDVDRYGYVPNGGRLYYLGRSQPPLLAEMVVALWSEAGTRDLGRMPEDAAEVEFTLALLRAEHRWWTEFRSAAPPCPQRTPNDENTVDGGGDGEGAGADVGAAVDAGADSGLRDAHLSHLARYRASDETPRPESLREDELVSSKVTDHGAVLADLRAAAESGWDFSSRWLRDPVPAGASAFGATATEARSGARGSLEAIDTSNVIPVDLNAVLYAAERAIAELHRAAAGRMSPAAAATHMAHADAMEAAAGRRLRAARRWLWNGTIGEWRDWLIREGRPSQVVAVSSAAAPLWAGLVEAGSAEEAAVVAALQHGGLLQPGGVATTTVSTGEQWDWPNCWPPLLHMLVRGLDRDGRSPEARALGQALAVRWLRSAHAAWKRTGYMFEKYDATRTGEGGGGGEYVPQVGFGWSNGAVLDLLFTYGGAAHLLQPPPDPGR